MDDKKHPYCRFYNLRLFVLLLRNSIGVILVFIFVTNLNRALPQKNRHKKASKNRMNAADFRKQNKDYD